MNVKNLFMGDVEPLLMSTIGKIKASKKKSLNHYSDELVSFWQNFPLVLLKIKLMPFSMEQCRSTCYFDDSMGIGMRTGFGTRMTVPRIIEDDAVVIQEDQSEENICKLPPVTPHLRACLAFMQKWTYDFR